MHEPPKILIVDDEPFNIDYLEQELNELGYQTVSAGNGQEALAQVRAENPDLVLLDIMMPVMDGFAVLAHLKADPATRDLPVIIISALHDMTSVVNGIRQGAEDYLPKPFEPVLLYARITASLAQKRLRDMRINYQKALERELEIGREIQAGFLPLALPQPPGWELDARFFAQRQVAGDLYDAFLVPSAARLCIVLGDVSGKGVGAALYMTLFRTLLRVLVLQADAAPGHDDAALLIEAVRFTSEYVARTHGHANMFASVLIGLLDLTNGALTFVNAGHNPPLLVAGNTVRDSLKRTGMVVGLYAGQAFQAAHIHIAPGESLLFYTDGVTEALSAGGQEYGEARLIVTATRAQGSARALLDDIESDVMQFMHGAEQADDITLLAVRRLTAAQEEPAE